MDDKYESVGFYSIDGELITSLNNLYLLNLIELENRVSLEKKTVKGNDGCKRLEEKKKTEFPIMN